MRLTQRSGDMKKTDMELQAIREKLRLLESEPVAGDVLSMPWSSPQAHSSQIHSSRTDSVLVNPAQKSDSHASKPSYQRAADVADSPQAAVMETLRKRSVTQRQESTSRANELVEQEIGRLELQARHINERSQQQATELLAMKRSAQQAAVALRRQGIHHPQLDTIAQFLEQYPSASVPHLERDTQGQFSLSHTTINLHHAEQEAIDTAQVLRRLHSGSSHAAGQTPEASSLTASSGPSHTPFSHPIESGPSVDKYLSPAFKISDKISNKVSNKPSGSPPSGRQRSRPGKQWQVALRNLLMKLKKQAAVTFSDRVSTPYPSDNSTEGDSLDYGPQDYGPLDYGPDARIYKRSPARFSWMDGAIWFSAAAIVRIVLEAIVLSYPPIRIPLMLILFSAISFSIYRGLISRSSDPTSVYRLGVVLLGLFIGGSF